MPATSKAQFRFMQAKAHGMNGPGPSPSVAKEFVSGQNDYGALPAKAKKPKKKKPSAFGAGVDVGTDPDNDVGNDDNTGGM